MTSSCEHAVQFYETDAFLLERVADFVVATLRAGGAGVIVATPAHRQALEDRLRTSGLDVAAASAAGRYVPLDAAETLSRFMVDGAPDPSRFVDVIGDTIDRVGEAGQRLAVFGEMVALLAAEGNHDGTIGLEALWNDLQRSHPFLLLCAYPMERLDGLASARLVSEICARHSRVVPAESYTALADRDAQLRAVVELQHKAQSLEAEIAQRKEAEARLEAAFAAEQRARAEAEAAMRAREEFLSIAAHELKTPVASIKGYAQLASRWLARGEPAAIAEVCRFLGTISLQADRLAWLVEQLLDDASIAGGRLELRPEPVDVGKLVEQVALAASERTGGRAITVRAAAGVVVEADRRKVEQVLLGLLDNAVKYSPSGAPIDIVMEVGEAEVRLAVRDRGIGVPPRERDRLFGRFYHAHEQDHVAGLGLGLSTAREIIERHGGQLTADFPSDGGSRFVVSLPRSRGRARGRREVAR